MLSRIKSYVDPLSLMASMGASAFLLFVLPHSPMAQPWPLLGGHAIAAAIALACGHLIDHTVLAVAISVGASVLTMQLLHCLHPPAAATALAVAIIGEPLTPQLAFNVGYSVLGGAAMLLGIAIAINHILLKRRYPLQHSHHPHHEQFQREHARDPLRLEEEDITWALGQMDGIVAATEEDLMDVYELALERAMERTASPLRNETRKRAG